MTNKNMQSRMDTMEEVVVTVREDLQREVGTIKDEIMAMNKRFDHLLQMQEEAARVAASSSGKGKESTSRVPTVGGPAIGVTHGSEGTSNVFEHRRDFRFRKLEMPVFDGTNPDGWILKAERYFSLQRFNNEEKLEASVIGFEGDALLWYQWEHKKRPMFLWEEMKLLILKQFRSTQEGSLHEQFLALRQQGTVKEYRRKFIEFLALLDNVSDEITLSQFINGLNPEIQNELRVLDPINLDRAMDLAQRIESKLMAMGTLKLNGVYLATKGNGYARPVSSPTGAPRPTHGGTLPSAKPYGNLRRLTDSELQLKRTHGLCYRCDEKWSPGHKCKKKELNVLITYDEEDEEEPEEAPVMVNEPILEAAEISEFTQSSGASNRVADALSRIPERAEIAAISVPQWQYWDQLKSELERDEFIKIIREDITSGRQPHFGFTVLHEVVYYKGRLVIPKGSKALYGRDPPPLIRYERGSSLVSAVDNLLEDRDAILDELRMHLLCAQQKMKMYADAKRHNLEFVVGDLVFLKLRPYRQRSLAQRRYDKLAARFYGPFKVLARIGKVAYKLELPPTAAIHPVFHVSQLRQALGVTASAPTLPPQLSADLELVVVPESLLGVRPKSVATPGHMEVLIKWKSLPTFEATWEDYLAIVNQFPEFHLEDKVNVWAGGNVRPQIRFTYSRRKGKAGNNN
ncbi:hypothetical protein EZV62_014766 [Acer yangbiense]|uniref:Chromo domain-containing protein n=1 Tax=Acer yangbiense TaxID=1000413 RepID=A0A5C7HSW3_9ROSI|nr:hypothetical protein EZV62_014766 [Acer yangbiense]